LGRVVGRVALLSGFSAGKPKPVAPAQRSRTFVLTTTATVPVPPAGTQALDLWLPVPHADANQEVANLKIDSPVPYTIERGAFGNQMLHLRSRPPHSALHSSSSSRPRLRAANT
jgi:hypothetical protein